MNALHGKTVALDTCVLINLMVTARLPAVRRALGCKFVAVQKVVEESERNLVPCGIPADALHIMVAEQDLEIVDLDDNGLELFVAFAGTVDDGEAATMAYCELSGTLFASDDGLAVNFWRARHDREALTTAGMLTCNAVSLALGRIAQFDCMRLALVIGRMRVLGDALAWIESHLPAEILASASSLPTPVRRRASATLATTGGQSQSPTEQPGH